MNKIRSAKGITLVALVITVIILLILAGVSIATLTGDNGLLNRATQAKEKNLKAQLKEEIELAIMSIKIREISKGNEVTLQSLANGQLVEEMQTQISATLEQGQVVGEYKEYEYIIDQNYNVTIMDYVVGIKPELQYTLSTEQVGAKQVIITVSATISEGSISKIIQPDGSEIVDVSEVSYTANKSDQYVFTAVGSNNRKTSCVVEIKNILPVQPVINIIQTGGYPIFTENGVLADKNKNSIEVQYQEGAFNKNYYSEDGGSTWKEYTGIINTISNNIQAKTVISQDVESTVATKQISVPTDVLTEKGYDGKTSTYVENTTGSYPMDIIGKNGYPFRFFVDESTWNKMCNIKFNIYIGSIGYKRQLKVAFINEKNEILSTYTSGTVITNTVQDIKVQIPEKTAFIIVYVDLRLAIYEVSITQE